MKVLIGFFVAFSLPLQAFQDEEKNDLERYINRQLKYYYYLKMHHAGELEMDLYTKGGIEVYKDILNYLHTTED